MEPSASPTQRLVGTRMAFASVPQQRHRAAGRTPAAQEYFPRAIDMADGPNLDIVDSARRDDAPPLKATKDPI